jgi:hypothetical protein
MQNYVFEDFGREKIRCRKAMDENSRLLKNIGFYYLCIRPKV